MAAGNEADFGRPASDTGTTLSIGEWIAWNI